jgi:MFS family permease
MGAVLSVFVSTVGTAGGSISSTRSASGLVLATLAAGQFVMTLDSSVMNVSMVEVAKDVGSDITGIQTAITLYTLVMAALMITGGKVGQIIGPKKAFMIGCVIYASGSLTTALAQSLPVLLIGWSFLEGVGAALILPALVALVAANFAKAERPRAYGLLAAAGAVAIAIGPLIGGLCTTYLSWRVVFVGEVVLVALILVLARRMRAAPPDPSVRLDLPGTVLSALGLAMFVFGVLRSGTWGFLRAKDDTYEMFGLSAAFWLMLGGVVVLWLFFVWEHRVVAAGREPLVDPALFEIQQLKSGLGAFFFQFLVQGGLFYLVALFLTVALGLTAIATGVRLMPLSFALLAAAVGVPKLFPTASPRRVSRIGFLLLIGAIVLLIALLGQGTGAAVVTVPLLLAGLGVGCLASQLGAVVAGSVPDERTGEVGGLQNTATNIGASIATALAGAVLIASLTTTLFDNLADNPDVPASVLAQAEVELSAGVPFVSDAQLGDALEDAGVPADLAREITESNSDARVSALRTSLALLALLGIWAFFATGRLPDAPPSAPAAAPDRRDAMAS